MQGELNLFEGRKHSSKGRRREVDERIPVNTDDSVYEPRWIPASETVTVHGRVIPGLVYVGLPPVVKKLNARTKQEESAAYINPHLPIQNTQQGKVGTLKWDRLSYTKFSKQNRALYLDWLANGRGEKFYNGDFVYLFLFGLERRIVLEECLNEVPIILQEIERLVKIIRTFEPRTVFFFWGGISQTLENFYSFANLLTFNFRDIAALPEKIDPEVDWSDDGIPVTVLYAIGARIVLGEGIPGEWLLCWFMYYEFNKLKTPAIRCYEEFVALFIVLFNERFPEGLRVKAGKRKIRLYYEARSEEFANSLPLKVDGKEVPDVSYMRKPMVLAQEIADLAMRLLEKYSRFIGSNLNRRRSLKACALLPEEIRADFPSSELKPFTKLMKKLMKRNLPMLLVELISKIERSKLETVTATQMHNALAALDYAGFGIEPDPRYALRKPSLDDSVHIFQLAEAESQWVYVGSGSGLSKNYCRAQLCLAIGIFVFSAYSVFHAENAQALQEMVSVFELAGLNEEGRLAANFAYMQREIPDSRLLRKHLRKKDEDEQRIYRAFVVRLSRFDESLDPRKAKVLEQVYAAMGVDSSLLYADVSAGSAGDLSLSLLSGAGKEGAEAYTSTNTKQTRHTLSSERVQTIQDDTKRVSMVLGEVFEEGLNADEAESKSADSRPARESAEEGLLPNLDATHSALVHALAKQNEWSHAGFEKLCTELGLLATGALEEINEWAFEQFDEALLEEDDGIRLVQETVDAVHAIVDRV